MRVLKHVSMLVTLLGCNIAIAAGDVYELYHRARFNSPIKGIYVSQATLEDRKSLGYLISRAKRAGINTFVVDLNHISCIYEKNMLLVKNAGLRYVARIVVFPHGADRHTIHSKSYLMGRYRLVDAAIDLGAEEIQLDYIRFTASNPPSSKNSQDVYQVIGWFKERIGKRAKLQVDIFGESCFKESLNFGQNVVRFAPAVDAVCPMLYPSHFEPYKEHAKRPYNTYSSALEALKAQFGGKPPFALYPFIELSNYRHSLEEEQLRGYIQAQIKAVEDAHATGWYAWSANNKYDRLFDLLENNLIPPPQAN